MSVRMSARYAVVTAELVVTFSCMKAGTLEVILPLFNYIPQCQELVEIAISNTYHHLKAICFTEKGKVVLGLN
jgi:hypothetical protein